MHTWCCSLLTKFRYICLATFFPYLLVLTDKTSIKQKFKNIGLLYWHILICKIRFVNTRKTNLINYRKQKLRVHSEPSQASKTELP